MSDNILAGREPNLGTFQPDRLNLARIQLAGSEVHGYGVITNQMWDHLQKVGANMLYPREFGWDWRLAIGTPQSWMVDPDGRTIAEDFCLHTMFDTDLIPDAWVRILNRIGLVWVPSRWCADTFRFSGVTRPIIVSGYGVDFEAFDYVERGWLPGESASLRNGTYTFVTQCAGYGDRKNEALVRQAFADLKLPDARLIVKMRDGGKTITSETRVVGRDIQFKLGDLSTAEWAGMLGTADCFVSASSGEGWSLTPMEAMATGLPTIVMGYGGPCDYIDPSDTLIVDVGEIVWAEQYNRIFRCEGKWALPDMDSLRSKMKWAYEHREEAAVMGRHAYERMRARFTWDAAMQRAQALLIQHTRRMSHGSL